MMDDRVVMKTEFTNQFYLIFRLVDSLHYTHNTTHSTPRLTCADLYIIKNMLLTEEQFPQSKT